jgi:dUTP pyrophosphatase
MIFKPVYPDAIEPKRATKDSAGYDLYAYEAVTILPGKLKLVKTGVSAKLKSHHVLLVCSRSGLALKESVFVLNAPGIVDADYFPNEIGVILFNASEHYFEVNVGDRIAQAVITDYFVADSETERSFDNNVERSGGFGSTGK